MRTIFVIFIIFVLSWNFCYDRCLHYERFFHCQNNISYEKYVQIITALFNMRVVKYDKKANYLYDHFEALRKIFCAGCPSFIHLEMALGWRWVVKNFEIHYLIASLFIFILTWMLNALSWKFEALFLLMNNE